jgi:hypothetical protein
MPIYALVDTWNASGTTFTGIGLNVTDTASAAGSLLMDLQVGGVSVFRVAKSGIARFVDRASARDLQIEVSTTGAHHRFFSSNTSAGFQFENNATVLGTFSSTTGLGIGNGSDLFLTRDAADTLAQRRGTNAQALRVYNTFTDASNYERGEISWSGNVLTVGTTNAGTGVTRRLTLSGAGDMVLSTGGSQRWNITGLGNFVAVVDNTYDIGASGANRPRSIFVGTSIFAGAAGGIGFAGRTTMLSGADGLLRLMNNAQSDFDRLQFGGTTSSFPALKRNSTSLQVRLADDSAFGFISGLVDLAATQAADSIGTRGVPQNSQSAAYTLVIEDAGKHILHPSADTTARTFTIPANSSVAFPVGTAVTFINQNGAGVVTIAITSDTMRLAGAGTTGSRTLAANGVATALKLTATEWLISGTGLT